MSKGKGNVVLGVLAGALAGATAGLLFAPKKGKDTRKQIASSTQDYVAGAKEKVDDVKNSIEHKIEALKAKKNAALANSKGEELTEEAKAKIHNAVS
ncbi:YtxH domain-containing protein [Mesonia sp. HuA40]|uniref:YtxH domain-containing protein n=1 Tax=Mesonia sp. HuA40 TaxID=2602761 RepID=UPI0011CAC929|nr:YtxH domain-containing protein [Mesonia sp. HuA40]TXK70225.1 YtxH domain-containing protein [Mesonia sp. HuA40]